MVKALRQFFWPQVEEKSKVGQKEEIGFFKSRKEMKTKTTEDFTAGRLGECQAAKDFGRSANQALVPTPMSVTDRANARSAPAIGVAHL